VGNYLVSLGESITGRKHETIQFMANN